MERSSGSALIPDATYAEQEALRFRIAARVRGILFYRLVNLIALPFVALLAWPSVQDPGAFVGLLLAGLALNGSQVYLHFLDHPLAERWWDGTLADTALYTALSALSGWIQSEFVYFFFPLIISSTVRFSRRASWTAGGLAVAAVLALHYIGADGGSDLGPLTVLIMMFSSAALASGEVGRLVTATRDRTLEAVMALVDANRKMLAEQAAHRERARQVRLLLDSTEEGIYGIDTAGNCTFVNPACLRMLGYHHEQDVLGKDMHDLTHHSRPDGSPYAKQDCRVHGGTVLRGEKVHSDQEVHWRADGTSFPVEYWARPIVREGRIDGAVVTFMDISERLQASAQTHKLSLALEQTADAVTITDPSGRIEYVNPAFEAVTGYTPEEAVGRTDEFLHSGQHDESFYQQIHDTVNAGEVYRDVVINRRKDGALYYEEKTITPVKDHNGVVRHVVSTGKDITERMENEQRLHYLANHDVLTGLPNRALLTERLDHALNLLRGDNPLGMLFLDVDRFQVINDTLGHPAGDALLKQLAVRLQHCVGRGDTVARLGGDEFAVLVEAGANTDNLAHLGQAILGALGEPFVVDGHPYFVTASLGISVAPIDATDAATLLKYADIAMYRAKELGRNRYHFYSAELGNQVVRRLRLESRLRVALEQKHFQLLYQPQVDVRTGRIVGFEALLRCNSPELDLVEPEQFIPILEETGLILPLGQWALETACRQVMEWSDVGEDLRIGVNVSGRQFGDPGFIYRLDHVLAATGLAPERLELEITESTIMRDDPNTMRVFRELASRGVRIAIDDFGTGYSSLSYLKRFPIDTLKIDRSFVRDVPRDGDDATIVQTILAMAGTLDLEVVAEGVETDEQFAFLGDYGCDLVQGWLFGHPMPPGPARKTLMEWVATPKDGTLQPANDSIHSGTKSEAELLPYVRRWPH